MPRRLSYSKKDIETIFEMKRKGYTYREIGQTLGRSTKAIAVFAQRYRPVEKKQERAEETEIELSPDVIQPLLQKALASSAPKVEVKQKTIDDFTSRELIRSLYKRGYRIEDGTLVFYARQNVNLADIISQ